MKVIVFKTNIVNEQRFNYTNYLLNSNTQVKQWSIDHYTKDKILRIEASDRLTASDVIMMLNKINIVCEQV